jgi:hypothetical protein
MVHGASLRCSGTLHQVVMKVFAIAGCPDVNLTSGSDSGLETLHRVDSLRPSGLDHQFRKKFSRSAAQWAIDVSMIPDTV